MEHANKLAGVESKKPEHTQSRRQSILVRIVHLLGWISLFGSVISFSAIWFWIADFVTQLTVQFAIFLLLWIGFLVPQRRWKTALVAGVMTGLNMIPIVPYFLAVTQRYPVDQSKTIRIACLNVLRTNTEFQATLDAVLEQEPDVIYLSEVQLAWKDFLEDARQQYPYQLRDMSMDYTGVVLLSRFPFQSQETFSIGMVPNPTCDVQLEVDGRSLRLIATHPLPPLGSDLSQTRDEQLVALANRLDGSQAEIMMGDLNQSPWSPKFRQLLSTGGLRDSSQGYGIAPTLAPLPTWIGGIKVDHFLINDRVTVVDYSQVSIPASDHRMIVLDCQIH